MSPLTWVNVGLANSGLSAIHYEAAYAHIYCLGARFAIEIAGVTELWLEAGAVPAGAEIAEMNDIVVSYARTEKLARNHWYVRHLVFVRSFQS